MPSLSRSCHTPATATKGTEPLPSHSSQKTRKTREGGGCLQSLSTTIRSPSKKRGASCLGGRFSWGKNGAEEESRHKITLLPKVINRDRYNYKRTRYHLPSLNGRWPSDTQVDLVLDSGHIINQQRSPSHHLSQSFRPPSLAARQLQSLFV